MKSTDTQVLKGEKSGLDGFELQAGYSNGRVLSLGKTNRHVIALSLWCNCYTANRPLYFALLPTLDDFIVCWGAVR
jgi:hypothetical protein